MFDVFYWSIGWMPPVLSIPLKAVAVIMTVVIIIKLVQAILSVLSAIFGFLSLTL